ncbi:MAG TPA: MlaD family protein [Opitutus sp.]|nr:MlaD family protein [Opitutus sp.]
MTATPKVTRSRTFPLVWVVPVVALAVAVWMIVREERNRGPEITIEFTDGAGVVAGQTPLIYKGVAVGTVQSVRLSRDLAHALVELRLKKDAASLASAGSQFWIVHPELSITGVRGLETLVRGVHLGVRPGAGSPAKNFKGLDESPPPRRAGAGRAFLLQSDKLDGASSGTPVYYRGIRVGSVESSRLANDAASVLIRIRVLNPYVALVRTNTRFWNAGVSIEGGLFTGLEIRNLSIKSLFAGGIQFATPDGTLAPVAKDSAEFHLADKPEKEWLAWQPHIPIVSPEQSPEPRDTGPTPALVQQR